MLCILFPEHHSYKVVSFLYLMVTKFKEKKKIISAHVHCSIYTFGDVCWDSKSPFCCYGSCPFWNIHRQYDDCYIIHWGKFDTAYLHLVSHRMNWVTLVNWINGHFIERHTLGSIKHSIFLYSSHSQHSPKFSLIHKLLIILSHDLIKPLYIFYSLLLFLSNYVLNYFIISIQF